MLIRKNDAGRSIVEMLGVLAIMGVITVMGISGYSQAVGAGTGAVNALLCL